jgi:DNA-binding transcriptional LysR family regulator
MFDLEDIRAFVAVAETGGFGRAGRRLGSSKSVVSRRIARLEGELGAQLLSRTTRGVVVTEVGLAFKGTAERVLADLEAARDAVGQEGDEASGLLRIAAPMSFGATHLAPVLAELALRHPRLHIQTSYSDRHVDLIAERFDVAIRLGRLPDSSLVARRIAPIHGLVVASPAYLERHGTPHRPADLADHEAILQPNGVWPFRDGRREIAFRPEGRFEADSGEAVLAAAVAGLGVAMLPTFLAGPQIETGTLVPLLLDYPTPEAGLYVVRPPPASHVARKVRALTDLLVERFGGEPYWDVCHAHRKAAADPSRAARQARSASSAAIAAGAED